MELAARLTVEDGKVLCPRTCEWEELGHCRHCQHLLGVTSVDGSEYVSCKPDVESLAFVVEGMTWADNP